MGENLRPLVGVGVLVLKDRQILLGKRKGAHGAGTWATPGGNLQFGENVEECAQRELLEETGLLATSLHLGPWVNNVMEQDKHYLSVFVYVTAFDGELELKEPHKCEVWQWFDWETLPNPLFPSITSLIDKEGPSIPNFLLSDE